MGSLPCNHVDTGRRPAHRRNHRPYRVGPPQASALASPAIGCLILGLAPGVGDVDLVVASESMEAGRAVAGGFVTPDRTTTIASTSRSDPVVEKMAMGDRPLRSAAAGRRLSRRTRARRCSSIFEAIACTRRDDQRRHARRHRRNGSLRPSPRRPSRRRSAPTAKPSKPPARFPRRLRGGAKRRAAGFPAPSSATSQPLPRLPISNARSQRDAAPARGVHDRRRAPPRRRSGYSLTHAVISIGWCRSAMPARKSAADGQIACRDGAASRRAHVRIRT